MSTDRTRLNALMDQASTGDDDAFGVLASAVQDELFRLALAQGLPPEDAVEVTQETLLRAYTGRRGWTRGSSVMAWLCGIAMNVVRESRRRRRRPDGWRALGAEAAGEAVETGNASREDPEADQLPFLLRAIDHLPPRQREAIACRYLRRMSIRETAQAMGCAEGTVKSSVAAALERLRSVLQRQT